jgi:hypothetical protein
VEASGTTSGPERAVLPALVSARRSFAVPQIPFHPGHDPEDIDPTWARGRQLARETINAALFDVDDVQGYGLAPATLEALRDPDLLVAFLVELRVWAELATRIVAEAQGLTAEEQVERIVRALDGLDGDAV